MADLWLIIEEAVITLPRKNFLKKDRSHRGEASENLTKNF